jgi:DNA-binding transcriptional ArsR family regulator
MEANPQKQENQIQPASPEKGIDASVFFGHNSHFAFVFRKTEKLVTAVYMITNFIKDNEPLKWKIREAALALMAVNVDFNTVSLSERRELLKEYQGLALEVVSYSSIAHHSGLISEMNFHILSREFNSLVSVIEKDENRQANERTVILDPSFFETPEPETSQASTPADAPSAPTAAYKGHPSRTSVAPEISKVSRKPEYFPMKDVQEKASRAPESKDSRKSLIIKLLSKKSGLNIKDFAESIKGCSEKTIQRELLSMVAAGVLKKEGERRWSTYSLAA